MEREVGGGIGMEKTCKLKDVSFQCMTKFTTNLKKKKEKKKKVFVMVSIMCTSSAWPDKCIHPVSNFIFKGRAIISTI